jgi:hypothetical protein
MNRIGQLHPANGDVMASARQAILMFNENIYLRGFTPEEIRIDQEMAKALPEVKEIDGLPVVADGTVRPGHVFVCCPDPDLEPA